MFRKKIPIFFVLAVLTCLLLVTGCTQDTQGNQLEEPYGSKEENIQTVEAVLKQEFTGPDKEFRQLAEKEGQEKFNEINSYLKNKYESYFTEAALEFFVKNGAYVYQFQNSEYQMSIEEMEVKQSDKENGDNIYYFTVQVALESSSAEKTLYEVTGEATFSEEGKIGRLQIVDREQQLSNKLNGLE